MSKFRYYLGWAATAGSVLAVVVMLLALSFEGWSIAIARIIWMPFVFLWGLKQIKEYRQEKQYRQDMKDARENAEWLKMQREAKNGR